MPRCIVLIRSHEPLQEGWRKRAFGPAGPLLDDRVRVAGVRFDETYHPVQVWRRVGGGDDPPAASGFNYGGVAPAATYAVRVEAEDEDAIQRLRRDRQRSEGTRLNSSHVAISYAVFCLKKKNETARLPAQATHL